MPSSSSSGTVAQLVKPEYRNWVALGHALTTELCQGLRPFINRETKTFYQNVTARLAGAAPCTCVVVPGRRPNQYHDMGICAWANILQGHHRSNKPNWKQSDSTKWIDPNLGPWEIAKLFLPDLGGHAVINSAEDMDVTGILNLMYWCNHFTIAQHLIKDVRETRNNKWVHVPILELTDTDKKVAFDAIENLLNDPSLAHDPDIQKALKEIGNLKSVSDLHSMEARVLADFKGVIQNEISSINTELKNLVEESAKNKEQQSQLKQKQEMLEKGLVEANHRKREENTFLNTVFILFGCVFGNLSGNFKGLRKKNVVLWLMLLLLFRFYVILDDSHHRDGCSVQVYGDPWELKYFDFSDFINSSRTEFIGRQWLYHELEHILEHTRNRGALITGNQGSGKSAFLSHLLCSTTSSPTIHTRILAHHFCMHFDKATQAGAKFVRNLANMIAWKISEYRESILTNSFVRRVLYKDCPQDPEWCFEQGILTPLKNIQPQPKVPWYVVIDALDECFSDKAEIVNILKSKARRLPKWLKLIVSSRNVNTIIAGLDGLQRVELRSDDKRNLEDVDTYISLKVFSLRESLVQRIKTSLAIMDNDKPTQKIVSNLAEKGQGNFLYVKVVLDLWLASSDLESVRRDTFPKTLDSPYQLYFERKYGTLESFQSLRQIFEVLVAAYTPLSVQEMHSLFKLDQPTLDLEYEFLPKLERVSLFLWHGSEDDLIRIHHSSLSEWLTSENNKGKLYYVKKRNGHNRLAKYYLKKAEENHAPLKPDEAFHLASHIVEGGLAKLLVQQFLSLPSEHINTTDPATQTTALHYSSSSFNTDVTKLLMQHFSNVDCLDNNQRTPSFIAATIGHVGHLMVLRERGADLHHTTTCLDFEIASYSQDSVSECKRKRCSYSLLHTAAQEGKVNVVEFLTEHNVSISRTTGANNTAIQLAAANGHLETVKTLKKAGGVLDDISLHHSAAGGHKDVVQYLLQEGVKDSCIHSTPSSVPLFQDDQKSKASKIHVYDNHHLYLRETALHAAVRKGHLSVIQLLLKDQENSAINCMNSAGRRSLHEAVYLNKYNELEVLLTSGANVSARCDTTISSSFAQFQPFIPGTFEENHCPCGFTPLHIAAMYGYHSTAKLLIKFKANVNAGDCNGSTPLHVAACHGMSAILDVLANSGADVNSTSQNGSTPLHSAAACFAKSVFRPLFDLGCDHLATDREGMTALHYLVKDVNVTKFEYLVDLYVGKPKDWIQNTMRTSHRENMNKLDVKYPWLSTLVELIKSFALTKRARYTPFLETRDKKKQSVFDKLEEKIDVPSVLIGSNKIRGLWLVRSLTPFLFAYDVSHFEEIKYSLSPLNNPYESASVPITFPRVISKMLASIFINFNCSSLTKFVRFSLVHTVNTVLQSGADVNCRDWLGLSPLLVYLRSGGRHMSKVLVKHNVEVEIKCGETFENSAFHLVSYHKLHYLHYLYEFLLGSDNWQKYLQTENAIFDYFLYFYEERNKNGDIETIRAGDGPLTKAILLHPNGTKVIDECFDEEGYNALQRAAQGANLIVIQKFLSWGANYSLKTADGFSPLWLSVLYAVKYRPFLNLERPSVLTALEVELASFSASAILNHILQSGTFDVGCNESRPDLTLYHIAATRGMWQFITHLLSSSKITGINVNCPNKDGITPMYLAKFLGGDSCKQHSPWCKVVDVIKSFGGTLQYPTLEAEYFLIFNIFFGLNPSSLFLELTEQEILALQEKCERDECQEYKASNDDLYRTSYQVDRIHNDYQKKVNKCSAEDCPADVKTNLPHFSLVVVILDEQLSMKLNFFDVRKSFITFLDTQIERMKHLLYTRTRPQEEAFCQPVNVPSTIDMCFLFDCRKQDLETILHSHFRNYKQSFLSVMANSQGKRHLLATPLKGKLSTRILAKINFALHSFDKMLKCDWQSIATKYVQLNFQARNYNYWIKAVHETSTVPSVSDFLSERMNNVILQPSKESRKLVLKLASRQPCTSFNYLKILRFAKPPLWHETFPGLGNFG